MGRLGLDAAAAAHDDGAGPVTLAAVNTSTSQPNVSCMAPKHVCLQKAHSPARQAKAQDGIRR